MNKQNDTRSHRALSLSFGFSFEDLYNRDALARLDGVFLTQLHQSAPELHTQLLAAREDSASLPLKQKSELIIAVAPHLEDFIGHLFGIEGRSAKICRLVTIGSRRSTPSSANSCSGRPSPDHPRTGLHSMATRSHAELETFLVEPLTEIAATPFTSLAGCKTRRNTPKLSPGGHYAAWAVLTPEGKAKHQQRHPLPGPAQARHEPPGPVTTAVETTTSCSCNSIPDQWRNREGFQLTDAGPTSQARSTRPNYCIKCHNQGKDTCSTGLKRKERRIQAERLRRQARRLPARRKDLRDESGEGRRRPHRRARHRRHRQPDGAGTGHRICNDCMKSCIIQKQEPVDIPQVETRTLKDVLELPVGLRNLRPSHALESAELRTPLSRANRPARRSWSSASGPAGFTLSHHLMNDGHTVFAVDGLKIEPLPADISGVDPLGPPGAVPALRDISDIYERLDERVMAGFGGVAEYGITVRWNKNFLKIVRLLIERRSEFHMYGGVRFGGTLTVDSAFELGFDHIALCAGAGRPTVIPMKNGLVRGVRQASDFLMALQLTGAAKPDSLANLQVRMPIVVIGGGLTAIDTATESLAYYVVQVEKFLKRHEALVDERGEATVRAGWTPEEAEIAEEFLAHARAIRAERAAAAREGRRPRFIDLLNSWGGVTIAYRRRLIDAPSYTLNHEEVDQGIRGRHALRRILTPEEVEVDAVRPAPARRCVSRGATAATVSRCPRRAILVAAGTQPNTVLGPRRRAQRHSRRPLFSGHR